MPVRVLGGMMWVLQPGLVHHATSLPLCLQWSSWVWGAQRQKSSGQSEGEGGMDVSNWNGDGGAPLIELTMVVWHNKSGPSVVELHSL